MATGKTVKPKTALIGWVKVPCRFGFQGSQAFFHSASHQWADRCHLYSNTMALATMDGMGMMTKKTRMRSKRLTAMAGNGR